MSLLERLEHWRQTYRENEAPVDEETVLRQFVYGAIADFLDTQLEFIEDIDGSGVGVPRYVDTDSLASTWTDLYAETPLHGPDPVIPKSAIPVISEDAVRLA